MTAPTPEPSVESFALSSALLRDLVTSWVPPNFGVTKPAAEREKEFVAVMSKGGRRGAEWEAERLGLGHPLLEPGASKVAGPSTARRDFSTIAKHLGKPATENGGSKRSRHAEDDDDDEEETSRFRSVGKGKGRMEAAGVQALLSGKKKNKKAKKEASGEQTGQATTERVVAPEAESHRETAPSIAPLAILKSIPALSTSASPEPDAASGSVPDSSSGKTKAERRREAKKRRKEEKKAAHGQ